MICDYFQILIDKLTRFVYEFSDLIDKNSFGSNFSEKHHFNSLQPLRRSKSPFDSAHEENNQYEKIEMPCD